MEKGKDLQKNLKEAQSLQDKQKEEAASLQDQCQDLQVAICPHNYIIKSTLESQNATPYCLLYSLLW